MQIQWYQQQNYICLGVAEKDVVNERIELKKAPRKNVEEHLDWVLSGHFIEDLFLLFAVFLTGNL